MASPLSATLRELNIHLPDSIIKAYETKGITKLFEWQKLLLEADGVVNGEKNLAYTAPTSAGKSLVAELLLISRFFTAPPSKSPKKKAKLEVDLEDKAILAVPFVSMVKEKEVSLRSLVDGTGLKVVGHSTDQEDPEEDGNIYVCTFENSNNLLNKLIQKEKLAELRTVVVDEVHLLGHESRGALVETLITKLVYIKKSLGANIQLVTMSATLSNLDQVGEWIQPAVVKAVDGDKVRPVPLHILLKKGSTLTATTGVKVPDHEFRTDIEGDQDHIGTLVLETLLKEGSALVFIQSKVDSEKIANLIGKVLEQVATNEGMEGHDQLKQLISEEKLAPLVAALLDDHHNHEGNSGEIGDGNLLPSVKRGVAFHHAGLSRRSRQIVEKAFRLGLIKVLVATSTLCAGVNLPARRVIITTPCKNPWRLETLDPGMFVQISGRAGRTGLDEQGECIVVCPPGTEPTGGKLVTSKLSPITSQLLNKKEELNARFVLEAVVLALARNMKGMLKFIKFTFLQSTAPKDDAALTKMIEDTINFLSQARMIKAARFSGNQQIYYYPLKFGKAVVFACVRQENAIAIRDELDKLQQKGSNRFTTCPEMIRIVPRHVFDDLPAKVEDFIAKTKPTKPDDDEELAQCGVNASQMNSLEMRSNTSTSLMREKERDCLRYRVAQMIQVLQRMELPLSEAADTFGISTGTLINVITSCASYSSHLSHFSRQMKWTQLATDLTTVSNRLTQMLDDYHWIRAMSSVSVLDFQKAKSLRSYNLSTLETLASLDKSLFSATIKAWATAKESEEYSAWRDFGRKKAATKLVKRIKKESAAALLKKNERDLLFEL